MAARHTLALVLRALPIALVLALIGCGAGPCDGGIGPSTCVGSGTDVTPAPSCNSNETGVVDGCGVAIPTVDIHDPVVVNLTGLTANNRYRLFVTDPASAAVGPGTGFLATADQSGNIVRSTVVQNMPDSAAQGTYSVAVKVDGSPAAAVQTITYSVADQSRVRCTADAAGSTDKASFLSSDTVYAKIEKGGGSLADGTYNVYTRSDLLGALANGDVLAGTPVSVAVASGTGVANLGTFTPGAYDVIVDVDANGVFSRTTDLVSRHHRLHPCFAVQAASSSSDVVVDLASDRNGNKRNVFDPDANIEAIRDVFVSSTPSSRSSVSNPDSVNTYVVQHQATWNSGDPLIDATAGLEVCPVQLETNAQSNGLAWEFQHLAAGCYDVVVDTNKDGMYTPGTDLLDSVNHLGAVSCGLRVAVPACSQVTVTAPTDGSTVTATAINVKGRISGTPVSQYLTITSGTQSNTMSVGIDAGGNFDLNLPLFNGANYITVFAINADGTTCAKTLTIHSQTELALFRAQLTWDGSTDMDLHVVRPGGAYSNGGGGTGDCNYQNCKVGLSGTGTNTIEWGAVGELDDPKLDVDCISCGNGIENIWMNQISEDGDYKVYIDAFAGSETDVTATIFVRGAAVGQVNCGAMSAGQGTDSCFVGTIKWIGGNSGSAAFIPSGAKASAF